MEHHSLHESEVKLLFSTSMKIPTIDGETHWPKYRRQFEAAAECNYWNSEEKATALIFVLRCI